MHQSKDGKSSKKLKVLEAKGAYKVKVVNNVLV